MVNENLLTKNNKIYIYTIYSKKKLEVRENVIFLTLVCRKKA